MHINARGETPSKALCFIIEYTPKSRFEKYQSEDVPKTLFYHWIYSHENQTLKKSEVSDDHIAKKIILSN